MKEGQQAALGNLTVFVVKLPRSEGRKRPRALVNIDGTERWVSLEELKDLSESSPEVDST